MMMDGHLQKDEEEDGSMYSAIDSTIDHDLYVHDTLDVDDAVSHLDADSDGYVNEVLDYGMSDNSKKFEMYHKSWDALYDFDGSMALRGAMKHDLYRNKFGEEVINMSSNIVGVKNLLIIQMNFNVFY